VLVALAALVVLALATAAPVPEEAIYSPNNQLRCRTAATHGAPPARLYNQGDRIVVTCHTNAGWLLTSDGCYVDQNALYHITPAYHPHGPGAGRKRTICEQIGL
jgi:hypothetical protein